MHGEMNLLVKTHAMYDTPLMSWSLRSAAQHSDSTSVSILMHMNHVMSQSYASSSFVSASNRDDRR